MVNLELRACVEQGTGEAILPLRIMCAVEKGTH